jgi:hypothetical protein
MAHFLCGERRVVRRPHPRNMGGACEDAKTTPDEISVMFGKGAKNAAQNTFARRCLDRRESPV